MYKAIQSQPARKQSLNPKV